MLKDPSQDVDAWTRRFLLVLKQNLRRCLHSGHLRTTTVVAMEKRTSERALTMTSGQQESSSKYESSLEAQCLFQTPVGHPHTPQFRPVLAWYVVDRKRSMLGSSLAQTQPRTTDTVAEASFHHLIWTFFPFVSWQMACQTLLLDWENPFWASSSPFCHPFSCPTASLSLLGAGTTFLIVASLLFSPYFLSQFVQFKLHARHDLSKFFENNSSLLVLGADVPSSWIPHAPDQQLLW